MWTADALFGKLPHPEEPQQWPPMDLPAKVQFVRRLPGGCRLYQLLVHEHGPYVTEGGDNELFQD